MSRARSGRREGDVGGAVDAPPRDVCPAATVTPQPRRARLSELTEHMRNHYEDPFIDTNS